MKSFLSDGSNMTFLFFFQKKKIGTKRRKKESYYTSKKWQYNITSLLNLSNIVGFPRDQSVYFDKNKKIVELHLTNIDKLGQDFRKPASVSY